ATHLPSGLFAGAHRVATCGHGVRRLGIQTKHFLFGIVRPKTQFDEGAGVRCDLGLPPIGLLVTRHGVLSTRVPSSVGLAGQVVFANQSLLDGAGSLRQDALLTMLFPGPFTGFGMTTMMRCAGGGLLFGC